MHAFKVFERLRINEMTTAEEQKRQPVLLRSDLHGEARAISVAKGIKMYHIADEAFALWLAKNGNKKGRTHGNSRNRAK